MKHVKNILVFLALWSIGYYFGDGNINDYKDAISIIAYLSGLLYLIRQYVL